MTDDAATEQNSSCLVSDRRFVVDSMLGKLAKWLRVLGFDTRCEMLNNPRQLDEYAHRGYRILTRNRLWARHPAALWVSGDHAADQLRQVVTTLTITPDEVHLKRRCLRCNLCLEQVPRAQVEGRVPDYVFENCTDFYHCPECRRFYWAGTHPSRMDQWLRNALGWTLTSEPQGDAP